VDDLLLKQGDLEDELEECQSQLKDQTDLKLLWDVDVLESVAMNVVSERIEKHQNYLKVAEKIQAKRIAAEDLFACAICLDQKKSRVCIPCGHTFCEVCVKRSKACALCRGEVQQIIPIFL